MSLLSLPIYLIIGFIEWFLALRRTLACARGEKVMLVSITFLENLLGLWVLSSFIEKHDWMIAISYSVGAALGSLLIAVMDNKQPSPS